MAEVINSYYAFVLLWSKFLYFYVLLSNKIKTFLLKPFLWTPYSKEKKYIKKNLTFFRAETSTLTFIVLYFCTIWMYITYLNPVDIIVLCCGDSHLLHVPSKHGGKSFPLCISTISTFKWPIIAIQITEKYHVDSKMFSHF